MGASVLIFANKTDVGDCMSNEEMIQVRHAFCFFCFFCFLGVSSILLFP